MRPPRSEFDSLTQRYAEQFAEAEGFHSGRVAMFDRRLATLLLAEDDSTRERWFAELENAADDEVSIVAGILFEISWPDHVADAARAARIMIDPARSPSARDQGHSTLGELAVREGRWGDARREVEALMRIEPVAALMRISQWAATSLLHTLPASEISQIRADVAAMIEESPRDRTLHLPWGVAEPPEAVVGASLLRLAVLSARLGEFEQARDYAAQLARRPLPMPWSSGTLAADFQLVLRAHILYWQGDHLAARAALDSTRFEGHWSVAIVPFAYWTMMLRAEVHYQLGELEEARRWYSLWPTRAYNSLRDLGPALYRLGQIHEALGEPEEARERYGQFISLWRNADPELQPLVAEARERISALDGQRR